MTSTRQIYLLRHGRKERRGGGFKFGQYDGPLNETGMAQARRAGDFATLPAQGNIPHAERSGL